MNGLTQQMIQIVTMMLMAMGVLAFLVSVITQVIKNLGVLKEMATNIVVVALSVILTLGCAIAYLQYIKEPILWYYIFACIIASFIISLISMQGWKAIFEIWNRTKYDKNTDIITDIVTDKHTQEGVF